MSEKELYIKADTFHIKLITTSDFIKQYIIDNISEFERLTISFELEEKVDKVDTTLQYNNKETYNFMCTENGYVFETGRCLPKFFPLELGEFEQSATSIPFLFNL